MNVAVYNGRFQFPTIAHRSIIEYGLKNFDSLILVIGSAETAPTEENPWSYMERLAVFTSIFQNMGYHQTNKSGDFYSYSTGKNIIVRPLKDFYEDSNWVKALNELVTLETKPDDVIHVINPSKDSGNYWLAYLSNWKYSPSKIVSDISASTSRRRFFMNQVNYVENLCLETVRFCHEWKNTTECARIRNEFNFHEQIREQERKRLQNNIIAKQTGNLSEVRYKTTYVTGDCAIIQKHNGVPKIVLITRKNIPGVGQLAIPGGYFEPDSDNSEYDTAVREAREEIAPSLTDEEFAKYAIATQIRFGDITRSLRGRILTMLQVFYIPENILISLTPEKSEVSNLGWYSMADVKQNKCFEDHFYMIARAFAEVANKHE